MIYDIFSNEEIEFIISELACTLSGFLEDLNNPDDAFHYSIASSELPIVSSILNKITHSDKAICEMSYNELICSKLEYECYLDESIFSDTDKRFFNDKIQAINIRLKDMEEN